MQITIDMSTQKNKQFYFMLLLFLTFSCKKKEENPITPISKITTLEGVVVNSADNQPVVNIPIYLAKYNKQGSPTISYSFDDKDTSMDFKPILMSDSQGKFKISFEANDAYAYSFYATKWTTWSNCNYLWECGTANGSPCTALRNDDYRRGVENKDLILKIDPTAFIYFKEKQTSLYDTLFTTLKWNSCDNNGHSQTSLDYYKGHSISPDMLMPANRPFTLRMKAKKSNKVVKDTLIQFQGIHKGDTLFYPIFY
jgi:5-hydroxyisourate hydrolase-like protein (transthyretin family)